MIPNFEVSFEVANYTPAQLEYLEQAGLYKGVFRKAFLYDNVKSDGTINTFAKFEFLCEGQKLANFSLFVGKNHQFSYLNKNGEKEHYLGFRQLNAIAFVLGLKTLDLSKEEMENLFGTQTKITPLNDLLEKPLILGFGTEEYLDKNHNISTKIFLERVFSASKHSVSELKEQKEPLAIENYKPRHKSLEKEVKPPENFAPKENKYIELKEDETPLPF